MSEHIYCSCGNCMQIVLDTPVCMYCNYDGYIDLLWCDDYLRRNKK